MKNLSLIACLTLMALAAGCLEHRVKTDPIEIKPIHITVDVNVRVDKQLDDFFSFEKELEETR